MAGGVAVSVAACPARGAAGVPPVPSVRGRRATMRPPHPVGHSPRQVTLPAGAVIVTEWPHLRQVPVTVSGFGMPGLLFRG